MGAKIFWKKRNAISTFFLISCYNNFIVTYCYLSEKEEDPFYVL